LIELNPLRAAAPPSKATICTVKMDDGKTVINCAGFKYPFPTTVAAAKFLGIPWEEFDRMILLNATNASMILMRKDHLEQWRMSSDQG
jgi:hypothetical protein